MGNCCVAGASSDEAAYKWSIDNFSSLLDKGEGRIYSRVFKTKGHVWYLELNPMKRNSYDEECVSLRLELPPQHSMKPNTVVYASYILIIYNQSGKHIEYHVYHSFFTENTRSSKPCTIKLAALTNSSGFLVNNSCVFGVKFNYVFTTIRMPRPELLLAKFNKRFTTKAKTTSETLFLKNTSTLPEAKAYTWCIPDFFGMENPGYSPEFTAGGYRWSIRLDKEKNNNISLYLKKMTNDLPEDYAVLVEFTLSVKNQEGRKHLKKTVQSQFSNDAQIWGWENVVSMEDMQDSSNGYLINTNKCCIEAEVKIIGSSRVK